MPVKGWTSELGVVQAPGVKPVEPQPWTLDASSPTRASLLNRLKDWRDEPSWREFFETYWRLIYSVALRSGLSESDAEDLVQDVVLSVAKKMPSFTYDPAAGSFKSWLLVVTRSRIIDHRRKQGRQVPIGILGVPSETGTEPLARLVGPAPDPLVESWEAEWRNNHVALALDRVKRKVKALHFQVYDLVVLQDTPSREVAAAMGVTLAQVYLIRHRVSLLLRIELKRVRATLG